jgi:hypothetical protein
MRLSATSPRKGRRLGVSSRYLRRSARAHPQSAGEGHGRAVGLFPTPTQTTIDEWLAFLPQPAWALLCPCSPRSGAVVADVHIAHFSAPDMPYLQVLANALNAEKTSVLSTFQHRLGTIFGRRQKRDTRPRILDKYKLSRMNCMTFLPLARPATRLQQCNPFLC